MQLELGGTVGGQTWTALSDKDFLKAVAWKRGAVPELAQAAKKGDVSTFVAALVSHWQPDDEAAALLCRSVWSLPAFVVSSRETALIAAVLPVAPKKPTAKKAASPVVVDPLEAWWLQFEVGSSALTLWEYLTLLEMLPQSFSRLTVPTAFALWRKLLTIASDLNQLAQMPDAPREGAAYEADLAQFGFVADPFLDLSLLRNCELPWLAGVVFAGVKGSEKLRLAGSELLEYELYERTDELGAPHADLLPRLPLWLAVTTRVLQTSALEEIPVWDADAAMHYQSLVEKVAPLIQPDGQFAVSRVQVTEPREFVEAVLWASGWPETEAALRSLLVQPRRGKTRLESLVAGITKRRPPLEICIAPVSQSDDASWAVLRSHWGAHADRVTVTHDQPMMNVEFTVQGQPMLDGEWYSEIQIGDRTTPFRGDWYCVCWQTDQDADYIELQLFIRGVVRVERQILLSRTRQFCLIAESLGDIKGEKFSYRTKLPLLEGVQATTSATTREVQLTAGGVPARVFPVTLPERHVVSTPGRFGNDFSFQTTGSGAAWYNPILIDWSPARRTAEATWKSLTVAEQQKVLKPEFASGHRVKVGNHQLLIYRSLRQSIEPRSVLGHQTRYETVIGAVENNGDITPLMLVE